MNLRTRLAKLEHAAPTAPLLIMDDAPELESRVAEAKRQGRAVIVVSQLDADL